MRAIVTLATLVVCSALEARWTPAADGGPARFSKRYRDAQGIDDSRWRDGGSRSNSDSHSGTFLHIFPETMEGWLVASIAGVICAYLMLNGQAPTRWPARGGNVAATPAGSGPSSASTLSAAEAAREAALKRHSS
jgi:hypothetical protein